MSYFSPFSPLFLTSRQLLVKLQVGWHTLIRAWMNNEILSLHFPVAPETTQAKMCYQWQHFIFL